MNRTGYFVSWPMTDPLLSRPLTGKELVSFGLAVGLPAVFIFQLFTRGLHPRAWLVVLAGWGCVCAINVFNHIYMAIQFRRYARAVDIDSVELGRKLHASEQELLKSAGSQHSAFPQENLAEYFDSHEIGIDLSLADEEADEIDDEEADEEADEVEE